MKMIVVSALAVLMAVPAISTPAQAQPQYQNSDRDRDGRNDRDGRYDRDRYERRDYRDSYYVIDGRRYERVRGPAWRAPPGYYQRAWARGQRLPVEYRRVVVRDYRAYHLAPPPRGYHYVRVDNDVVLTAIASGIIGGVVANVFMNN